VHHKLLPAGKRVQQNYVARKDKEENIWKQVSLTTAYIAPASDSSCVGVRRVHGHVPRRQPGARERGEGAARVRLLRQELDSKLIVCSLQSLTTVAIQDAIRFRCQVCSEYDLCAV
jgi:hypothetical protein